jgi:uncharacterized protein
VFFDPSVRYGLQFETAGDDATGDGSGDANGRSMIVQMGAGEPQGRQPARKPRSPRKSRIEKTAGGASDEASGARERPPTDSARQPTATIEPLKRSGPRAVPALDAATPDADAAKRAAEPPRQSAEAPAISNEKPPVAPAGGQVVSLDAFRKK